MSTHASSPRRSPGPTITSFSQSTSSSSGIPRPPKDYSSPTQVVAQPSPRSGKFINLDLANAIRDSVSINSPTSPSRGQYNGYNGYNGYEGYNSVGQAVGGAGSRTNYVPSTGLKGEPQPGASPPEDRTIDFSAAPGQTVDSQSYTYQQAAEASKPLAAGLPPKTASLNPIPNAANSSIARARTTSQSIPDMTSMSPQQSMAALQRTNTATNPFENDEAEPSGPVRPPPITINKESLAGVGAGGAATRAKYVRAQTALVG